MYLDSIIANESLVDAMKVYKAVHVVDGNEFLYGVYREHYPGEHDPMIGWIPRGEKLIKLGAINTAEIFIMGQGGVEYNSGFHCSTNLESALRYIKYHHWYGAVVLHYIIPPETTVLYGRQDGDTVVITPTLSNPRASAQ